MNAPGLEVDDEQYEVPYEPAAGDDLHAEEVRGGDGTPMRLEKGLPGHRLSRSGAGSMPCSARMRWTVQGRSPGSRGRREARIAPRRILARHRQQLRDLVTWGGWTARAPAGTIPVVLRSDLLAVPAEDGLRRCERRHLGKKLSAERLSLLGEQPSLGVGIVARKIAVRIFFGRRVVIRELGSISHARPGRRRHGLPVGGSLLRWRPALVTGSFQN